MRKTLIETTSLKEACEESVRLEKLFLEEFGRSTNVSFFIFGANSIQGITMEWEKADENEAEWFTNQVKPVN